MILFSLCTRHVRYVEALEIPHQATRETDIAQIDEGHEYLDTEYISDYDFEL